MGGAAAMEAPPDARRTDGASEKDTRMGWLGMHPAWLQRFGTAPYFLVALCCYTIFQSMTESGLLPVIISSIERRYGLNSKESGFIVSFHDVIVAISVIIMTHYGHRAHIPRWLARSMLILAVGCFFFIFPEIVGSLYTPGGSSTGSETCPDHGFGSYCSANEKNLYGFFVLGQFFLALASAPLYTLAITFLDNNTAPDKSSVYVGTFFMFGAIGPAIGYLLGGVFLDSWVDPGQSTTLTTDSSAWVGAWWAGFVLAGGMVLILCPLMFVFPKHLPGTEWIREHRASEKEKMHQMRKDDGGAVDLSFKANVISLLKNNPYLFMQLGSATEALVIVGIGAFLPKVVQTQFLLSASDASFLSGVSVIIGAAGGIFIGGLLARKWTPVQNAGYTALFAVGSVACSFILLVHCSAVSLVGVSTPYPLANASTFACSAACNCSDIVYKPMCAPTGDTYSSVCHAGCTTVLSPGVFTNCSCLPSLTDQLTDGKCRSGCGLLPLFLVVTLILMLFTFLNQVPITVVTLRCVQEHQRSLGLGISSLIYRSLGSIPGPLIVGAVLDLTCILWETKCDGTTGSCWEYNSDTMSRNVFLCLLCFKLGSLFFFSMAYFTYRPSNNVDIAASTEGTDITVGHYFPKGSDTREATLGGPNEVTPSVDIESDFPTVSQQESRI